MDERFESSSIEGYFDYSSSNEGAYVKAGPSGKFHVQQRSSDGHRLLFVSINTNELELDLSWECIGLSCYISESLIIGEKRFVVECSNANFFEIFNRLLAGIISDEIYSGLKIIEIFRFEKSFYSGIPNPLTEEMAVGLFGELFLMSEWFSESIPLVIENNFWKGPTGASKDYSFSNFQIEVKATMSEQTPIKHKISSLTQLQQTNGPLILYSLVALADPNGENSLNDLVEQIRGILIPISHQLEQTFLSLLEENSYIVGHPSNEKFRYTLPLGNGEFYSVSHHFPRLVPSDDSDDDRIHIQDYSITLVGVDDLKLSLSPPINEASMLHEYSRVSRENDQGSISG